MTPCSAFCEFDAIDILWFDLATRSFWDPFSQLLMSQYHRVTDTVKTKEHSKHLSNAEPELSVIYGCQVVIWMWLCVCVCVLCTVQYVCLWLWMCDGNGNNYSFPSLPVLVFGLLVEHRNRAVSLINMNNETVVCFHSFNSHSSACTVCMYCMCETQRDCVWVCVPFLAWQYFMHDSHCAK